MKKPINLIKNKYIVQTFVVLVFTMLNSCADNKIKKNLNQRSFNEEILKSYKEGLVDSLNTNQMLLSYNIKYTFELQNLIDSNSKVLIPFDNIIDIARPDSNYIFKISDRFLISGFANKKLTITCGKNEFEKIWSLKNNYNKDIIDRNIFLLVNIIEGHKIEYTVTTESIDSESEYSSGDIELNYGDETFEIKGSLINHFYIDQKKENTTN